MEQSNLALVPQILAIAAASVLFVSEANGQAPAIAELSGLKRNLDDLGIHSALVYDGEGFADISGGAERGVTYRGNLNLQLTPST